VRFIAQIKKEVNMSWIKIIDEKSAEGKLKKVYDEITKKRGKLSNIMRIHSLNPEVMKAHIELYIKIMFSKSKLKREEREMIAVIVSKANKCDYCINHHAEALNFYWKDEEKLKKFIDNYKNLNLPERQKSMLDFAIKLTENPDKMSEEDVKNLRKAGFEDDEILDIVLITSYFNFVNRIANGLGVEFNEEEVRGYKY